MFSVDPEAIQKIPKATFVTLDSTDVTIKTITTQPSIALEIWESIKGLEFLYSSSTNSYKNN